MNCLKNIRRHILFISVALVMQWQCSAMEQMVSELGDDIMSTSTYYRIVAKAKLLAVDVGKLLYEATVLLPQFVLSGFHASSHSVGSVMLYALESAMTTMVVAGACFLGWAYGELATDRMRISFTRQPKVYITIRILWFLLYLFFPYLWICYRKGQLIRVKEKREAVEQAKKLKKIKTTHLDSSVSGSISKHHNIGYNYSKQSRVHKYVAMYVITYIGTIACGVVLLVAYIVRLVALGFAAERIGRRRGLVDSILRSPNNDMDGRADLQLGS